MPNNFLSHPSSYRDPSGFIFETNGVLYRQVNQSYRQHFDHFINSGFYEHLARKGWIIPHEQVQGNLTGETGHYVTLRPERIGAVSYPYEWSFDMLREAALLSVRIAKEALGFGMILKDATPFNIQFHKGRMVFIDTLSFEKFEEAPWIAYRQFCEQFLSPLLIMHYSKSHLPGLSLAWPEGIPLAVTSSLLPFRSKFSLYVYLHIHLNAKYAQKKQPKNTPARPFSKQKLMNLLSSLESLVARISVPAQGSTWSEYYDEASQRNDYLEQKKKIISTWVDELPGISTAVDLGANEGEFSKLLAEKKISTTAADFDPFCINKLYHEIRQRGEKNILPVCLDLSNPSPSIGVNGEERKAFFSRINGDLVLALALVHHLAIGKNIPLDMVMKTIGLAGTNLIIEFIPKTDEKIQLMLSRKPDIYTSYSQDAFETALKDTHVIRKTEPIGTSGRILYLAKKK